MKKVKIFCLLLGLLPLLLSCNWFTPKEWVVVDVHNSRTEAVIVDTGLALITVEVGPESSKTVQIVKGKMVSARGKDSGTVYSTRVFYADADWYI